jgi:hypothetical protein
MAIDLKRQVWKLAAEQRGLVATWQLASVGATRSAVNEARRAGWLRPAGRAGVLRVAGTPDQEHDDLAVAVLAAGPGAAAASFSALQLLGDFGGLVAQGPLHVVTAGDRSARLSGVSTHRTRWLPESDVAVRRGIRCTTFARTLLDLMGQRDVHWTLVARVFDRGLLQWPDAVEDVGAVLDCDGTKGLHGVVDLRRLVEERVGQDAHGRLALQRAWCRRCDAYGLGGIDEFRVDVGGRTFFVDRAWPARLVGLEVKGFWGSHGDRVTFDADAERENLLRSAGWQLLVATSKTDPSTIMGQLRAALAPRVA